MEKIYIKKQHSMNIKMFTFVLYVNNYIKNKKFEMQVFQIL